MSSYLVATMATLAVGLGVLAATTQGCGGGGSAGNGSATDVCNKFCDKQVACSSVPGNYGPECRSSCSSTGMTASMTNCPGLTVDQAVAVTSGCLAKSCADLKSCFAAACPAGGGSAGTAGSIDAGQGGAPGPGTAGLAGGAGTGGAAGGAGTAGTGASGAGSMCETVCARADACCAALQMLSDGGTNCMTHTDCNATGTDRAQTESNCNAVLLAGAFLGPFEPAACK
jgi:hypothetical protein